MINELTRKNAHIELDHIFKTILPAHGMTERPEQIRLSHTMLDAMCEKRIALSDAGTGIGKTYAYLTAAIVYSHSRLVDGLPFQPVIIATSSIALQNAIVREYLPFLSDALSDDPHITTPILAALRKGKSHYVCDERLRQHLQQRPNGKNAAQKQELYSLRDVLDLDETQKLSCFDRERVCVPQFCDCKHPDCRYRRHLTECGQKRYLFQICNQNLWLADCMHRENGLKPILPDACSVIVDEAHKLPETAREMFGTTLLAGEIRSAVVRLKQDGYALAADRLFSASSTLLQKMAELSPECPVELLHDDLSRVLSTLFLIGRKLSTFLEPATKRALEQLTDKVVLFLRPKTNSIRYTAEDDDGKLMLCSVPADITARMQNTVWSKQIPLLLTSGTLAIGSSFRRFQDECGLSGNPRVTEAVAVSPFDYAANCRLFFRSDRLAFQRTSGIPKLLPGRFYACCKPRMDMPLFFSPLTRICPLSVNVSTGSKAASPSSSCAGTTHRSCGNSRAPPEPSFWQPALRGRAWTSPATVCRCSSFHACRSRFRTPSTSMKRETILLCMISFGASSCRKCRSSSSRASDAPFARKRTPAWLPSWMSDAAPKAATDRMYWTRCRKCRF